jgi:DNA repair protein RadD
VLDFAKLVDKHGPVDMVQPKTPGKGDGEAPIKICPQEESDRNGHYGCGEKLHASARTCPGCGFVFPDPEMKITATAAAAPILSTGDAMWRPVSKRTFRFHEGKVIGDGDYAGRDSPPSVKVTYMLGLSPTNEWLCPQHMEHPDPKKRQFPVSKADRYWSQHGGSRPFPRTVMDWLERQNELLSTDEIRIEPKGRFWNVKDYRVGGVRGANDNEMPAANDNVSAGLKELLDDEIPY